MRPPDLRPTEATGSIMSSIPVGRLFFVVGITRILLFTTRAWEVWPGHEEPGKPGQTALARTLKPLLIINYRQSGKRHGDRAMRLSFRLICSLVVVLTLVSFLFSYVQVRADKERRRQELRKHTQELAERLQDSVQSALEKASRPDLRRIVERPGELEGVAIYDRTGAAIAVTSSLAVHFPRVSFLPALPAGATGPREVSAA